MGHTPKKRWVSFQISESNWESVSILRKFFPKEKKIETAPLAQFPLEKTKEKKKIANINYMEK
jgi:hypothetical protein